MNWIVGILLLVFSSVTVVAQDTKQESNLEDRRIELAVLYYAYMNIKTCYEIRKGYALQYITLDQLEYVKENTKRVEEYFNLPKDIMNLAWKEASDHYMKETKNNPVGAWTNGQILFGFDFVKIKCSEFARRHGVLASKALQNQEMKKDF